MQVIETQYNGYRFRSRLEARWAVFFDALGWVYRYEPEGYVLDDGEAYLPDFYLPTFDVFVEIKGQPPTAREKRIALAFAREGRKYCILYGACGVEEHGAFSYKRPVGVAPVPRDSSQAAFTSCRLCAGGVWLLTAYGPRLWHDCTPGCAAEPWPLSPPRIVWAYEQARSARFEGHAYRQTPLVQRQEDSHLLPDHLAQHPFPSVRAHWRRIYQRTNKLRKQLQASPKGQP